MEWKLLYGKDHMPTVDEAGEFSGPLLGETFLAFMRQNCPVVPKMEYSACAMQTGWNIKFKKSGKNVCTVYPMDGYFICMILTGGDSMMELEARLEEFTPYMREKFRDTKVFRGSRWLFLEIRDGGTERDLEELVLLKLRSMGIAPGPVTVREKNGRGKGKRTRDEN